MKFEFNIESNAKQEVVTISGSIDENSNFDIIKPKASPQLVIDLHAVSHINSLGLRNWVRWVKSLKQYPGGIFLRNCPVIAVHQINILEGFLPLNAVVESLEVPFLCDSCGELTVYRAVRGTDFIEYTEQQPEKVIMTFVKTCSHCGAIAQADIIPAKYFKFLKRVGN